MTKVVPQRIYLAENKSFVLFERGIYVGSEGPKEKRIYYLEPHLALIVGVGYGMLVQTMDGTELDKSEVEMLDGRGTEAEKDVVERAEKLLSKVETELLTKEDN